MVHSSAGIIPGDSPAVDCLTDPGVSIAIVQTLLGCDGQTAVQARWRMLAAFGLGAVCTAPGAFCSALIFCPPTGWPGDMEARRADYGYANGRRGSFAAPGRAFDTSGGLSFPPSPRMCSCGKGHRPLGLLRAPSRPDGAVGGVPCSPVTSRRRPASDASFDDGLRVGLQGRFGAFQENSGASAGRWNAPDLRSPTPRVRSWTNCGGAGETVLLPSGSMVAFCLAVHAAGDQEASAIARDGPVGAVPGVARSGVYRRFRRTDSRPLPVVSQPAPRELASFVLGREWCPL